jgi:predicted nucleotidyltransferase
MSMVVRLHDITELPLPDEIKEAVEEILGEQEAREELMRIGILGLLQRKGSGIRIMDASSREDYEGAVNELVAFARDKLGDKISSIYVVGSYARGDFIPGRSNIDLFIVVKGGVDEVVRIQKQLEPYAAQLNEKYLSDVGWTLNKGALGLYYTNFDGALDFYVDDAWEYHLLMRESKLLYGEDIRPRIHKPDPQKVSKIAQDALKCFNTFVQSRDCVSYEKCIPLLFGLIFKTLALYLSTIGVYVGGKQDVLRAFKRLHPNETEAIKNAERAYGLWVTWGQRDLEEREVFELRGQVIQIQETVNRLAAPIMSGN